MPFLNTKLLRWMIAQPRDYDVLAPCLPGQSRQGGDCIYQTLHAIYNKHCLPAIKTQLERGNYQVVGFFGEVNVRVLNEDEINMLDPGLRSFFNVNTPESLIVAQSISQEADRRP
jgi:molybdopterin-guanine dinucleotide biosynthesis protein A